MTRHGSDQHGDGPATDVNGPGPARMTRIVAGEYLLTVNPVDGSEIQPCPPGEHPGPSQKLTPCQRDETGRAAAPVPAHPPLVEREDERERLRRLLTQGCSVLVTGPAGSGRSALLEAVAEDVAGLAPDGVIRLSGRHRSGKDLLYALFAATHDASLHRPGSDELCAALRGVGAVVVLDDLECGGEQLGELLDAAPECAFLLSATPEAAGPVHGFALEELTLPGISRPASLELLEHAVQRPLTDEEADRATDLWLASDGLPLSFVRAGALLRRQEEAPSLVGEIAAQVADGLSESAREALRFAVALDGHLPHHSHLPAVADDPGAAEAVAELAGAGLVTRTGAHHRLAAGVARELAAAGYAEDAGARTRTVAQHYAWWVAHPSVTLGRIGSEADVVLAALEGATRHGDASTAVLLARTAAPALASALRWSAWERALRAGQEAARVSGEIAEQAYFHHESGVLSICTGRWEQARAELETSTGLRKALSDQRGVVAGRRALALVSDRLAAGPPSGPGGSAPRPVPDAPGTGHGVLPGAGAEHASRDAAARMRDVAGLGALAARSGPPPSRPRKARSVGRKNLAAGGAGALLALLLGGVVLLGQLPGNSPSDRVRPRQSEAGPQDGELTAEQPEAGGGSPGSPTPERRTSRPGPTSEAPSRQAEPTRTGGAERGGEPAKPGNGSGSSAPGDGASSGGGPSTSPGDGGGSGGSGGGGSDGGSADGGGSGGGSADGGSDGGASDGGSSDGGASDGGTSDGGASDGGGGGESPPESSPGTTPSSTQPVRTSQVDEAPESEEASPPDQAPFSRTA